MKTRRLLIVSFIFLAAGVGLICGYCNGTAGFSAGIPLTGSSIKIDITTAGLAAITGVPLTLIGLLLLIFSVIAAIIGEIRAPRTKPKRLDYEALAKPRETSLP
jgi:uncharacterized membrane protein